MNAPVVAQECVMPTQISTGLESFTFLSRVDGSPVFARKWLPPTGIRPQATVQITHGISEHSGRYDRFARFLAARGCVVYAIDLRGHGQTAGAANLGKGSVSAWEEMTADILQQSENARNEYPNLPLIAFGHSMGSALTQSHIQNHGDLLTGAILCGTMGSVPTVDDAEYPDVIQQLYIVGTGANAQAPSPFFGELLTRFNAPFVKGMSNPTGSEWQTSDPAEIRLFQSDPLCAKPFSNAMTYSVIKGFHDLWLPGKESRIPADLPILILAGTEDPVGGRTKTIQRLITSYLSSGHRGLSYRFYPDGRHEILNEPERDQVHRDIGHWLDQILDTQASANRTRERTAA
jgi:alpha-beta hydrolase superfamily lysophospholipase